MKLPGRLLTFLTAIFLGLTVSAQLPAITIKAVDGETVDASTLGNDGKPYVVSFFATWCKPCLRELRAIHELYPDWQEETGMKLIAISLDEGQSASRVKPLVDGNGWDYEVYIDENSEVARTLGIQTIPHLLIVDGSGNIVESHSGYTDGSEEHIIEVIRGLIQQ